MVTKSELARVVNDCGCGGRCGGTGACSHSGQTPGIVPPHLQPQQQANTPAYPAGSQTMLYNTTTTQAELAGYTKVFFFDSGCNTMSPDGTADEEPFICDLCPFNYRVPTVVLCSADGRPLGYAPVYNKDGKLVNWQTAKPQTFTPDEIDIAVASSLNALIGPNNVLLTGLDASPLKTAKVSNVAQSTHIHAAAFDGAIGAAWIRVNVEHEKRRAISLRIVVQNFLSWIGGAPVNREFVVDIPKDLSEDCRILVLFPYLSKQSQPAATWWVVNDEAIDPFDPLTSTCVKLVDMPANFESHIEWCNAGSPAFKLAVFSLLHFLPFPLRNQLSGAWIQR